MATANEYIFFEPDQVLTNDHLNETFNYLDQQNRWTRNKLIGIGIACGFNLSHQTGIIQISGGCGVTSQGYLILQQTQQQYAYIMLYSPVDPPADLPFTYTGSLPFFKPFCTGKTIYLLLTDDDYNALEEAKKPLAKTLSSQKTGFLKDYVVVLFLEVNELDLKNCDTFDCTNKGERMQFKIRPLLVNKKDISDKTKSNNNSNTATGGTTQSHQIKLKRYNVPYTALQNHADIIRDFASLVDDETLQEVSNALNYCYQQYGIILNISSNTFINLFKELQTRRDFILHEYPVFIQYFYDFVDDLINAYYEFRVKISGIITQCCPDENLFPLHLVLGDASKDTETYTKDIYRTYFIYSSLFAKGNDETNEGLFFYQRMEIMVKEFEVLISALRERTQAIKITPSEYGLPFLSERAIPYYYNVIAGSKPLYKNWSYYKTSHGNAAFNQSYNAYLYNSSSVMVKPLLYDIEHYNFFRIEGHIGENYQAVLNNLLKQRLDYNLPFDVVAISADLLRSNATLPQCNMQDLETDYKLIVSEFACKVHTPFCFLTKFPYPPDAAKTNLNQTENLQKFSAFKMDAVSHFAEISYNTISTASYKKGDFMRKYCAPLANTIGSYYLQQLKSGYFRVDNIQGELSNDQNSLMLIYNYILAFIDAVEEIMFLLMTKNVATLSIPQLKEKYEVYTKTLSLLTFILAELITGKDSQDSFGKGLEVDMLIDEFFILSSVCIDERLQTLIEEYQRRLFLYQSQNTFLNYFKKHPGLEHKAGVPKGGTFVIVYYESNYYKRGEMAFLNKESSADISITEDKASLSYQQVAEKNYYLDNDSIRLITDFVEKCKDAPDNSRQKIIDIINRQRNPVDTKFSLTNGAVIADFYIPYLCCSDCPPIAYILPKEPEQPPADTTVFSIKPNKFLFDDAHNYPFMAAPLVTNANKGQINFTSPDLTNPDNLKLLTDDNNILYLHPAMDDLQQTLNTTLTYKAVTVAITIVKPDASFTLNLSAANDPAAGGQLLQLTAAAKQNDATAYKWTVMENNQQINIDNSTTAKAGPLNLSAGDDLQTLLVQLDITYVLNDDTSTDTKSATLTFQQIHDEIGKPDFEPKYDTGK